MKEIANLQQILFESWIVGSISILCKKYNLTEDEKVANLILKKLIQENFEPTTNILGIYFMDQYLDVLFKENGKINITSDELCIIYSTCFLLSIKVYEDINILNSQFCSTYNLSKENITLKNLKSYELSILTKLDYKLIISPEELFDYMISTYSEIELDSKLLKRVQQECPKYYTKKFLTPRYQ